MEKDIRELIAIYSSLASMLAESHTERADVYRLVIEDLREVLESR